MCPFCSHNISHTVEEAMKVQHLTLRLWDQVSSSPSTSSSLSSSTGKPKRHRPLAPRLNTAAAATAAENVDSPELKSFNSPLMAAKCSSRSNFESSLLQSGGTRWNPMPEQIKLLEALYQGGMRTPNPVQIERITAELGKYGRIEGKNVFYWFQNHKARERQKQKRTALLALAINNSSLSRLKKEEVKEFRDGISCKRRCRRSWSSSLDQPADVDQESGACDRTLELFPLHPEWKQMG